MEFADLISYKKLQDLDPRLFAQVTTVYDMVKETINGIAGCFNNYTMHDIGHSVRVANYMEQLAFGINEADIGNKLRSFNAGELAIMLLSALLHDIGMFIRPCDRTNIQNGTAKYSENLTYAGVLKVKHGDEEEAVKEIVRLAHAKRVTEFLEYRFDNGRSISEVLKIDDKYSYWEDVGVICRAHGESYDFIKTHLRRSTTKGTYEFNSQYIAILLRIADLLDLDRQRTPMLWYSSMGIEGFSKEEWEKHFQISNERKLKPNYDGKMQIYFDGVSSNAKIHRKYLKYIDDLRDELENADLLLNNKDNDAKYHLNLTTKVEDMVNTKGFQYSDLRLNLDYAAITELLMGKNIYGDSKLGLRELIQNSIDACKIMKEVAEKSDDEINPSITIKISQKDNSVIIKDTGIGMTLDVIKNHFLNIGRSYYKSNEYLFKNFDYKPIGQYGIGFLACFLLSDNVIVRTRHYLSNEVCQIELEKSSEYVVTNTEESVNFNGTEIQLDYDKFFESFKSFDRLKDFISTFFYTDIPIVLFDCDDKTRIQIVNRDEKIINSLPRSSAALTFVDCEQYSDLIRGKIALENRLTERLTDVRELGDHAYLYDEKSKMFSKVTRLEQGYYYYIPYAVLEDTQYKIITRTRKEPDGKAKAILAAAKENGSELTLYAKFGAELPFATYTMYGNENKNAKKILEKSGLPFYRELFLAGNHPIFASGEKFLHLYFTRLYNKRLSQYASYLSNDDLRFSFSLYYKGILVSDFRGLDVLVPYPHRVTGYIDYIGDHLKLDVSRNEIIEGYPYLSAEVLKILLKFELSLEKRNDVRDFIRQMLSSPYLNSALEQS